MFSSNTSQVSTVANWIEDCFSCFLYTGNGSTQTITNGIDLSTKGGLVWIKSRSAGYGHYIFDTNRGALNRLASNGTGAESSISNSLTSFLSNGFSLGSEIGVNESPGNYASWTFRKQPKFFDVVTYTGNGTAGRTVAHSLGSVPGCIIIKRTDLAEEWVVYHRSLGTGKYMRLASTAAEFAVSMVSATSTTNFTLTSNPYVNDSGGTYVAYLFAHDAGGFGLTGTDNVITCGSYTGTGSTGNEQTLGYEPQWILVKNASISGDWNLFDNFRGVLTGSSDTVLLANTSGAESGSDRITFTATGFSLTGTVVNTTGDTYIYIAIRRGPMKTPTDATKVFMPVVYTGTNVDNRFVDTTISPDMIWGRQRDLSGGINGMVIGDRMRGFRYLVTGSTAPGNSDADSLMLPYTSPGTGTPFSIMGGFGCGNDATSRLNLSTTSNNQVVEAFRRAPSFFDIVCYTGTASNLTLNHNLGVAPELIITKNTISAIGGAVYSSSLGVDKFLELFAGTTASAQAATTFSGAWLSPTATTFGVGVTDQNNSGETYVAYLFASCLNVSKVGSYTGTGTTLQIDCGFTGGARFVLIKRTDSTGDWYVWDSARGIVAGNDPYLLLNSQNAEVTNTDYIDTYSAGFEISSTAPAAINANGGSFIFLAIA